MLEKLHQQTGAKKAYKVNTCVGKLMPGGLTRPPRLSLAHRLQDPTWSFKKRSKNFRRIIDCSREAISNTFSSREIWRRLLRFRRQMWKFEILPKHLGMPSGRR